MQDLLIYLPMGALAGLQAGLLGVGGGLVIVPVLLFTFALQGFESDFATHMAVGTSLATIFVTSISSVLAHRKHGNIDWTIFQYLAPGIVVGVWVGVQTALSLSGTTLQLLIASFAMLVALKMALGFNPKPERSVAGPVGLMGAGSLIGCASSIFGIGGGTLTVPFLRWSNVSMQKAVGISAACGMPIAFVGALTNMWEGMHIEQLPEGAVGYVYLPAFIGIVSTSAIFAKLGAKLASSISEKALQWSFIGFLVLVSLSLFARNLPL